MKKHFYDYCGEKGDIGTEETVALGVLVEIPDESQGMLTVECLTEIGRVRFYMEEHKAGEEEKLLFQLTLAGARKLAGMLQALIRTERADKYEV